MEVRKIEKNDLESVLELINEHFRFEYENFDKKVNLKWPDDKGKARVLEIIKLGLGLVCFEDGNVVGMLLGKICKNDDMRNTGKTAELAAVFVKEDFRGKGVSDLLIRKFFEWCSEKRVKNVRLEVYDSNDRAAGFYRKHGFKNFSKVMEKRL